MFDKVKFGGRYNTDSCSVAVRMRLTDEYQEGDQQLQVSVNNSVTYDCIKIHLISSHLIMQQTTYAQMDGQRFSTKKMMNDLTKFHCTKHRELSYLVKNTSRTKRIVQTKLERKITIRIDSQPKFYPVSFAVLPLSRKQNLITPYWGIVFYQGKVFHPSCQNVTYVSGVFMKV
jgi:hypothetical protein